MGNNFPDGGHHPYSYMETDFAKGMSYSNVEFSMPYEPRDFLTGTVNFSDGARDAVNSQIHSPDTPLRNISIDTTGMQIGMGRLQVELGRLDDSYKKGLVRAAFSNAANMNDNGKVALSKGVSKGTYEISFDFEHDKKVFEAKFFVIPPSALNFVDKVVSAFQISESKGPVVLIGQR